MTERVDVIVVGAGVVGLAIARAYALQGREVLVLEAETAIGSGTSSRNSEVIHAGIYYPTGSLKARLCVAGKDMLYDYCRGHGVDHDRIGKLIVACSPGDVATLKELQDKGRENGVDDLELIGGSEARALEPAVACEAALLSPSTGIIDSHGLMLALQGDIERAGGVIALNARMTGARPSSPPGFEVEAVDSVSGHKTRLSCATLVNSAGLGAWSVARGIEGLPSGHVPPRYLSKGCYYTLAGPAPFKRPVYPVPRTDSLGIHATVDLGGQLKFGPNAQWVETIDYGVAPEPGADFVAAIRRYYPDLDETALAPGYAGIRPKVQAPGEAPRDFVIQGPAGHGLPGLVNLFGMESPGLTACLAIAALVTDMLR